MSSRPSSSSLSAHKNYSTDIPELLEEEEVPSYVREDFYPARIGDVLKSRYRLVTKLGFGVSSTVWLCRDMAEDQYLTLKLRVKSKRNDNVANDNDNEIAISKLLAESLIEHPGKNMIRRVLDSFEVVAPNGNRHMCLLYPPAGMNYTNFIKLLPEHRLPKELAQRSLQLLLIALDYMHQCHVVHTDISPNNVLQGVDDSAVFSQIEQDELKAPSFQKVLGERIIYQSRQMPLCSGLPVLGDLGEARAGDRQHVGDIMPGIYRSPEVILDMKWYSKVDIWAMGIMAWDLFEGGRLFYAKRDRMLNDEQHLAEMVSLLGNPPPEFLSRSEKCQQFWDSKGNWKGSIPIPEQSFEMRERCLNGEEQSVFLRFIRRMLQWMPEDRPPASELAYDDFLMEFHNVGS